MKKIFLILTGVFGFYLSYGQKAVSNSNASKATVTSGVANPTINGKPYSQYKAEQDALKIQNTSKANTLKPVGDDPINSKVAVPVNKNTNAQKPNVLSPGENRKPIPVTNPAEVVKTETPQQKVSTPDFSHPASITAAGNTAANKTTTPTVGDAGKNVPAGSIMGSVKTSTEGTVTPNGNATNLPPDTYDPKGAKQVSNKVATTDQNVKPVVSEVKTEKSTLPPVAVPVSAGSKGN